MFWINLMKQREYTPRLQYLFIFFYVPYARSSPTCTHSDLSPIESEEVSDLYLFRAAPNIFGFGFLAGKTSSSSQLTQKSKYGESVFSITKGFAA